MGASVMPMTRECHCERNEAICQVLTDRHVALLFAMTRISKMSIFEKIKQHLDDNGIEYRTLHHEPTTTSEASAKVRGEDLKIGGKALVMKIGDEFKLFILSASLKVDSKKIKSYFNIKKTRFADSDELKALTGLVPGSVPPFGRPILDLDLFVDRSIMANDRIAFNAGSLTDSIIMATDDFIKMAKPEIIAFSKE
jgi:Ala-tRNA(Pro) deacylase